MFRKSFMTVAMAFLLAATGHAGVLERILAVVNDRVITLTDVDEEAAVLQQLGKTVNGKQVLDILIERDVVVKEAGRLGITVSMDEITRSVLSFEETFPSKGEFDLFLKRYEMNLNDLSNRFYSAIAVERVRQQKDTISEGRYEKWLEEALKKADIRIVNSER